MTDTATPATPPDRSREVRLGIVMYGGIALAIYIYGVAAELFRAVRGQGVFKLIKALTDSDIVVDVISGTSAGGINGILLGYALCNERDFMAVSSLWSDNAAIDKMLRKANADVRSCTSLLDSEGYYRVQLERAFSDLSAARIEADDDPSDIEELDLYVTGTDVDGNRYTQFDDAGHPIDVKDHRTVFLLKHRKDRKTPFAPTDPSTHRSLAKLARLTSCFPAAFAPVRVSKTGDGAADDAKLRDWGQIAKDDAYFLDGGVLDNKPFTYTIKAIFSRTADREVERKLLYVEPDPETFAQPVDVQRPDMARAVLASLISIPGYESIADDLKLLAEHNSKLEQYNRLLEKLEDDGQAKPPSPEMRALWLRSRLVALSNRIVEGLLKTEGRFDLIPREDRVRASQLVKTFDDFAPDSLTALFGWSDIYFQQRRVERVVYLIDALLRDGLQRAATAQAYDALRRALNRQIRLYDIIQAAMEGLIDAAPFDWRQQLPQELWVAVECTLKQLLNLAPGEATPADQTFTLPSCYVEPARDWLPQGVLATLNDALKARALRISSAVQTNKTLEDPGPKFVGLLTLAASYEKQMFEASGLAPTDEVRSAYDNFENTDARLFPLELVGSLKEKDLIQTVRISPADAQLGFSRRHCADKLAGDTLYHFGGFFKASWRSNDILWGRLDGLCQLCEVLLSPDRLRAIARDPILLARVRDACSQESLNPAQLFPRAGARTHAALEQWIARLLSPESIEAALQEAELEQHRELLIEAAQLELLHDQVPQVVDDAIREQTEWNRYRVLSDEQVVRALAPAQPAAPTGAAPANPAAVVYDGPAWSFRTGAGRLDPLVAITAAARIARSTTPVPEDPSIAPLRPSDTALGRFFTNHYAVGTETFAEHIPRLIILDILSAALLVMRQCVLCAFGESGARVRQNPLYWVCVELPLRLLRGLVVLLTTAPGWGASAMITLAVMAAFVLGVDAASHGALTNEGGWRLFRLFVFLIAPIAILVVEVAILVVLERSAGRDPTDARGALPWAARGLAAVVGAAILAWTLVLGPVDGLPGGSRLPGIALELPRSPADVASIAAGVRAKVFDSLWIDSYVSVPVYVIAFCALGWLFVRARKRVAGAAMIASAVAAGVCDELENYFQGIMAKSPDPAVVDRVREAAMAKWTLLGVVMMLLSTTFLRRRQPRPVAAAVCLSSALLMILGAASSPPVLEWGFTLMGAALLLTGAVGPPAPGGS